MVLIIITYKVPEYADLIITIILIMMVIMMMQVPEYADFGDLREDIFFPGEFDLSQFGNQTMPSVIWSTSGGDGDDDEDGDDHDHGYADDDDDDEVEKVCMCNYSPCGDDSAFKDAINDQV